jgi:hypothetical protein
MHQAYYTVKAMRILEKYGIEKSDDLDKLPPTQQILCGLKLERLMQEVKSLGETTPSPSSPKRGDGDRGTTTIPTTVPTLPPQQPDTHDSTVGNGRGRRGRKQGQPQRRPDGLGSSSGRESTPSSTQVPSDSHSFEKPKKKTYSQVVSNAELFGLPPGYTVIKDSEVSKNSSGYYGILNE